METEERFNILEERLKCSEEEIKILKQRLNAHEEEIERIQKDLQLLGENSKIETPCFVGFENSLTKKLMKEKDEDRNSH